jgi:hypothetical protein
MVALPSAPVSLIASGNDRWQVSFPGFTENGAYQVVVHARSNRDLYAQPLRLTIDVGSASNGEKIYLPAITR